jgi:hypothetical protein
VGYVRSDTCDGVTGLVRIPTVERLGDPCGVAEILGSCERCSSHCADSGSANQADRRSNRPKCSGGSLSKTRRSPKKNVPCSELFL